MKLIPKDSKLFPLPPDYHQLTEDGQRQARVNATRLWMVPRNHEYWEPNLLVASVLFFDEYYLKHDMGMFYPFGLERPNPAFHNDILRSFSEFPRLLLASPRDSAKSTVLRKYMSCAQISCPRWSQMYVAATHPRVKETMTTLKNVAKYNSRVIEDFGPEYGGEVAPSKGKGLPYGNDIMYTNNHSWIAATSIGSAVRGGRPHILILDDIEQDYKPNTDTELKRQEIDYKLNAELLPMVFQEGARCIWIGTTISLRHFICHALAVNKDGKAMDERFNEWCRMRYQSLKRKDGEPIADVTPYIRDRDLARRELMSLWPDRFTVDQYLNMAKTQGPEIFMAEYMSDPRTGSGTSFFIQDRHTYKISNVDQAYQENPRKSEALIHYEDENGYNVIKPYKDFLNDCYVVQCVDWAATVSASSDYSVVATLGITPGKQLFVLDMWSDKVLASDLAIQVVREADKWKPGVVGIEAPDVTFHLFHLIHTQFEKANNNVRLVPLKHNIPKVNRIDGLKWRFGHKQVESEPVFIKFPKFRESEPAFARLFSQLEQFNPYVQGGNLPRDDELDTVSMIQGLIKGVPTHKPKPTVDKNPIERLADGEIYDENGEPLAFSINWSNVPRKTMIMLSRLAEEKQEKKTYRI